MSDEPAIIADNISKMYHKRAGMGTLLSMIPGFRRTDSDEFWALKDISFEVKRGEILGIIGPNGAGKSTILKILSRVTSPTSGAYQVKGRLSSLIEVGAGFHPELTGRENVYLNAAILGMSKKEAETKFDEIVEFAELGDFIDVPVKRYSSGMHVRLGFAVAAHIEPDVLLVDEVLAVGDQSFRIKCFRRIRELLANSTVVMVSHNLISIERVCERVISLDKGVIVREGPAPDVISWYLANSSGTGCSDRARRPSENPVSFFDGQLKRIGASVEFSVGLDTGIRIARPNLVAILWKGGVRVCNIASGKLLGPVEPGRHRATLVVDDLPLSLGHYHVSVRMRDFVNPLDTYGIDEHAADLLVEESKGGDQGLNTAERGVLSVDCSARIGAA